MRKHISSSLQIVLALFLALVAGLTARAQTFTAYSNAVVALNPLGFWPLQETVRRPPGGLPTRSTWVR